MVRGLFVGGGHDVFNSYVKLHDPQPYPIQKEQRLWVEEAEAPFRCRLQREGLKFSRDITKWEKRMPLTRTDEKRDVGNVFDVDDHDDGIDQGESNMGKKSGTSEGHGAGFCAFPLVVHNSHAHHVVSERDPAVFCHSFLR